MAIVPGGPRITVCIAALPSQIERAASTNKETSAAPMQRQYSKRRASIKGSRSKRRKGSHVYVPPAFQVRLHFPDKQS